MGEDLRRSNCVKCEMWMHWLHSGISGIGGPHLDGKAPGGAYLPSVTNIRYEQDDEEVPIHNMLSQAWGGLKVWAVRYWSAQFYLLIWEWWDDICWVTSHVCS